MNIDLEQRIRNHYAQIADELTLTPIDFHDLAADRRDDIPRLEPSPSTGRAPGRRTWWLAAAALVVAVVGLAPIVGRWYSQDNNSRGSEVASSSVLLSEVTDVDPTDWVIATTLPDDRNWMYAPHPLSIDPAGTRLALYGTTSRAGTFERLRVSVTADKTSNGGESIEIAGTTWTLDTTEPGRWTASRQLNSSAVVVRDSLPFDDIDRAMLANLVVVPESALPTPTLGNPDRSVEVARYELGDETHALSVQESNGYWCFFVDGSGGCGETILDTSAAITIEGGTATVADASPTADVVQAGTATASTTRIEVEFRSGTVVTVAPIDLSGRFDRKFWIAAATLPADNRSVLEVRGYDANGQLLATTFPS